MFETKSKNIKREQKLTQLEMAMLQQMGNSKINLKPLRIENATKRSKSLLLLFFYYPLQKNSKEHVKMLQSKLRKKHLNLS